MKNILYIIIFLLCATNTNAQTQKKFDPARFEAELEQFITTDACLSPDEASRFFPLYREMRKRQKAYFGQDRRYQHIDITDDKLCAEAIRTHDNNDIAIKRLQQEYHEKFMLILPASKVFRIIQAEEKYHRRVFEKVARKFNPKKGHTHKGK